MRTRGSALQGKGNEAGQRGFLLAEYLIATSIIGIVAAGFIVFMDFSSRSIRGVTKQSVFNQGAGQVTEFLIHRIRLSNTSTVDSLGNTLTLTFDDDPAVDSSADGIAYNDIDHTEVFAFQNGDGSDSTAADNKLVYTRYGTNPESRDLMSNSVRKLTASNIFSISCSSTVFLNFGLVDANKGDRYQAIDIRTRVVRRNKKN